MICPKCGTDNMDNAVFCSNCGTDLTAYNFSQPYNAAPVDNAAPVNNYAPVDNYPPVAPVQQNSQNNGMAIGSLVCAILSWFCCPFILGIVAIVLGVMARQKDKDNKLALAGIIVAIVGFVFSAIVYIIAFATGLFSEMMYYM